MRGIGQVEGFGPELQIGALVQLKIAHQETSMLVTDGPRVSGSVRDTLPYV